MSTISKRLMALALLAGPMATNADSVTFDFTGVVTTVATGPSSFLGTAVTGTFTFTYTSADTITGTVDRVRPGEYRHLDNRIIFSLRSLHRR